MTASLEEMIPREVRIIITRAMLSLRVGWLARNPPMPKGLFAAMTADIDMDCKQCRGDGVVFALPSDDYQQVTLRVCPCVGFTRRDVPRETLEEFERESQKIAQIGVTPPGYACQCSKCRNQRAAEEATKAAAKDASPG